MSAVRVSDNLRVLMDDMSAAVIPFPMFAQFDITALASATGFEVQGFTVRYERLASTTAVSANETWIQLISGAGAGVEFVGTTVNSDVGNWSTTEAYVTAGGSGTMFGMTTANASAGWFKTGRIGFAVNIRYGAATTRVSAAATIDHMQLQVHYAATIMDVASSEYDREHQSARPSTNLIPLSSEYASEHKSAQPSINLLAQSAEFIYEAGQVDLTQIVPTPFAEYNWPVPWRFKPQQPTHRGARKFEYLIEPFSGEWTYESGNAGLTNNQIVTSAEFVYEAGSGLFRLNQVVQSAEFDYESRSAALAQLHVVGALSAEFNHEASQEALSTNVIVVTAEFNHEASIAALSTNVIVVRAEFDWESSQVDLVTGSSPFSQLDWPVPRGLRPQQPRLRGGQKFEYLIEPFSGEWGYEAGSVAFSAPGIEVFSAEFAWEGQSVKPSINIVAGSAEFDRESTSVWIGTVLNAQSAEFDYESGSVGESLNLVVVSLEFDWEAKSVLLPVPFAEYNWPVPWRFKPQQPTHRGARQFQYLIEPNSAEFDHEITSAGYLVTGPEVFSGEWVYEAGTASLSKNVVIASAEFDYEASEATIGVTTIEVKSAEFGYEASNVGITHLADSWYTIFGVAPAPRWWQQPTHRGGTLAPPTPYFEAFSSEYGYEAGSVRLSVNLRPVAAEFDYESGIVHLDVGVNIAPSEYGWEGSSAQLVSQTAFNPDSLEFEREFGSAHISRVIIPQDSEYDYESGSVGLRSNCVAQSSEYDWEGGSPDITGLSNVGVMPIGAAEFDWEAGGVRLRMFQSHMRRDRIKIVRQI